MKHRKVGSLATSATVLATFSGSEQKKLSLSETRARVSMRLAQVYAPRE
jgi:hypothetical protein